jgi:hypothetical protein
MITTIYFYAYIQSNSLDFYASTSAFHNFELFCMYEVP